MKLPAPAAAALSLTLLVAAHPQSPFTDPANLRGERPSPRTGRELPLDGGLGVDGQPRTALALQQLLRKLSTRASLMLIVAHPDDEDGGMLTFYSRGLGARVADLSLTRGEGGQNAMTGDFEDALGLIRTQELLAADRYSSTDQFFGTEVDFGFSKTKEEAFRKWTHERVLYDAVRAVRLYRPLVLAAVFVGGVTDGHGQHQVSGQIAQEVFKAAADPGVFPELTREGILPWAPLKVYARVPSFAIQPQGLFDYATNQYVPPSFTNYVTGVTTTTPPTPDVIVHEGQPDPLLTGAAAHAPDLPNPRADPHTPLSYVQFARIGLGLQRTQIGPGFRLAPPGAYDVAYHRYGSRLAHQPAQESSFFDGIDTSVAGVATLAPAAPPEVLRGIQEFAAQISSTGKDFDPQHPERLAPRLVHVQHQLGGLLDAIEHQHFTGQGDVLHELRIKQVQLNNALAVALGLRFTPVPDTRDRNLLQGKTLAVATTLQSTSEEPVGVYSQNLDDDHGHRSERLLAIDTEPQLTATSPFAQRLEVTSSETQTPTRPYFFRTDPEQSTYQLRDPSLRNAPATPPALTAWTTLRYHETEIQLGHVLNAGAQPVEVVPPASVAFTARATPFPQEQPSVLLTLHVTPPGTRVEADLPRQWKVTPDLKTEAADPGTKQLRLEPPAHGSHALTTKAEAIVGPGEEVGEGYLPIGYGDLPFTNIYAEATLRLVPVDLTLPHRRHIGYLAGTGDAVADGLRSVGFEVTNLTIADLTPEHLAHFDTIILGVRTYNAHPDLHGAPTEALLNYARNGGNVIVQYQTAEFTGSDAPYPLKLGNAEKVVDETTPVRLLTSPGSTGTDGAVNAGAYRPLFVPNRITEADFNGWIEERGHGFLQSWDSHYTALTETHDPGSPAEHIAPQLPQRGGLVTTQLGRGHWTYVAFALYRQMPEAVPGAYRLFTNLIALADPD